MDIRKTKSVSKPFSMGLKEWMLACVGLVFTLIAWAGSSYGSMSLERRDLLIAQVQQGDLEVVVDGYGVLTTDKQQLITAFSQATVKEIVLKPGARVTTDSVIVRLENPELVQQLENEQQEFAQARANLRQLKLNNQREYLRESAVLAEIRAAHETAQLKKQAEEKLVQQGIVSQLTYQQSVLDEKQLSQRISILNTQIDQLKQVHQESVNIQLERIKQQQGRLNIARARLDKLTVRAGFDGVLQRLAVELGQSLNPGQEVALIGSVTDLIALVRIPQGQVTQVEVGQKVWVNTRRDRIEGKVSRIDPIVANNTVEVEVALPAQLPDSARPQLNIDALIIADTLENAVYMQRPAGTQSQALVSLYRLERDEAQLQGVKFGVQSGDKIQVLSGAEPGEEFIITDLSNLHGQHSQILIQ